MCGITSVLKKSNKSLNRRIKRQEKEGGESQCMLCSVVLDDESYQNKVNSPLHIPLSISTNVERNIRFVRDAATSTTPSSTISRGLKWRKAARVSACAIALLVLPLLINAANDNSKIGDRMRSKESSFSFFTWVDNDGDGVLKRKEMENFVRNSIGGSEYDTDKEVSSEVDRLMESLDQNHDENLDYSDVFSYWKQLENLLTVNEVKDWIIYALQLPEIVAKTFAEHSVTGYDFPELVENDGEAIEKELGIEKAALKKKLLRSMRVKLVGMGSVPGEPLKLRNHLESCTSVSLEWKKPGAISYPVHSYRIQRRLIPLKARIQKADQGSSASDDGENVSNVEGHNLVISSSWETVYFGPDTHYVDYFVEQNYKIVYRVQAWNAIGHSNWVIKDISSSLKRQKCYIDDEWFSPSFSEEPFQYIVFNAIRLCKVLYMVVFDWVTPMIYYIVQTICTFLAIIGAIIRYRRASSPSSSFPGTKPLVPWVWGIINRASMWLTGHAIVPDQFLENSGAGEDIVDGERSRKAISATSNVQLRRTRSNRSESSRIQASKKNMRSQEISLLQRNSSRLVETSSKANAPTSAPKRKLSMRRLFSKHSKLDSNTDKANRDVSPLRSSGSQDGYEGNRPQSQVDVFEEHMRCDDEELSTESDSILDAKATPEVHSSDDDQHCVVCGKEFRFGKRWKHHCARCLSVFCHKHGHATHKNYSSCKVPGDCVCNLCLEK